MRAPRKLRCAVYTRKSTGEGLEKDFNTLEAQRESASAYIASQKSEGWIELVDQYDDGGFSGGTLERPALKRLIEDVESGYVDIVVVYKIDRISRSLSDFCKLVEVFEKHKVTFVSVTQSFNTTTSMGRLILNILLSFAQFERELGSERVRDKVALSRAKGMWMGGMVPLGYDLVDKRLVINPLEASQIVDIFNQYGLCPSMTSLIAHLDRQGSVTKSWVNKTGEKRGGLPFKRATLTHILSNPVYVGVAVHKDLRHPGQHEPIIDQETFDEVQSQVSAKTAEEKAASVVRAESASGLLRGLLYGAEGYAFVPTYTGKGPKQYRYYVNSLSVKRSGADCEVRRLPAGLADQLVVDEVRALLQDRSVCDSAVKTMLETDSQITEQQARSVMSNLDTVWITMQPTQQALVIQALIERIDVRADALVIRWRDGGTDELMRNALGVKPSNSNRPVTTVPTTVIALAAAPRRPQHRRTPVVKVDAPAPDPTMLRLIAKATDLNELFEKRDYPNFERLANETKLDRSTATRMSRVAWLSPRIKRSIVAGTQPLSLAAIDLMRWPFPDSWAAQEQKFFSGALQ